MKVKYHDKKSKVRTQTVKDLLFTFDLFQFGLECVSLYTFEIDDSDYPLFGEIWEVADCLIREPIMFLNCDYVKQIYSSNKGNLGERIFDKNSQDSKIIKNISESDFVIFDRDIDFRSNRLEQLLILRKKKGLTKKEQNELILHKKWCNKYKDLFLKVRENKYCINDHDCKILRTLCPFTWKLLEAVCRHDII